MSEQADLFTIETTMHGHQHVRFHGPDVEPKDAVRLTGLLGRVAAFMSDGQWHTLPEIAKACNGMEASVSARLRGLRNDQGWTIDRKRDEVQRGLFWYRGEAP